MLPRTSLANCSKGWFTPHHYHQGQFFCAAQVRRRGHSSVAAGKEQGQFSHFYVCPPPPRPALLSPAGGEGQGEEGIFPSPIPPIWQVWGIQLFCFHTPANRVSSPVGHRWRGGEGIFSSPIPLHGRREGQLIHTLANSPCSFLQGQGSPSQADVNGAGQALTNLT